VNVHSQNTKRVLFSGETIFKDRILDSSSVSKTASSKLPKHSKHHSQPILTGPAFEEAITGGQFAYHPSIKKLKDKRFDSFKTWSGKLERQITLLRGKLTREAGPEDDTVQNTEVEKHLPVDRYFDALEGPELDTLKVCVFFPQPYAYFSSCYILSQHFGFSHIQKFTQFTKLGHPIFTLILK
jgi:hypothetical protein